MNPFYNDLEESVKAGFLNQNIPCKEEYLPQILVNDYKNGKKVLTTILRESKECKEFWLSVAFVTKSGVATIIDVLKELEEKNIKGRLLVSQYQYFTEPEALKVLLRLTNIELRMAINGDFHAKGYLFKKHDGYSLIIGSSNLTDRALCVNKEWNLKISATENSAIIINAQYEFQNEFEKAAVVDTTFIQAYEAVYTSRKNFYIDREVHIQLTHNVEIKPNRMQEEALSNLGLLRSVNKRRALLISATATGKTYLSALDVQKFRAQKCLFVVHRANIAEKAMESFQRIFGNSKTMGMYSGERRDAEADFLFSTIQTISKDDHLFQFNAKHFDYIIIDETHRAGAESYRKIIDYFQPKFLLGMTATPERTDQVNIFEQFDYNIAYEIRLHRALEEEMVCPFHYYGITDVFINGKSLDENTAFNLLISEERVNRIIEKASLYGCDNGCICKLPRKLPMEV